MSPAPRARLPRSVSTNRALRLRLTAFRARRRALLLEPTRTATLCNYAYLLHSDKRMGEAREVFDRACETNPGHPWVKNNSHLFA